MAKIIQVGNSLAITIPSKFASKIGIKKGDSLKIKQLPDRGEIHIIFKDMRQLPLLK